MAFTHDQDMLDVLRSSPHLSGANESPLAFDSLLDEIMLTNEDENSVPRDSSQDTGSGLFVDDNDFILDEYSPTRDDRFPSPSDADSAVTDATVESDASEIEELKQLARAEFSFNTCPYFEISSHVQLPEYAAEISLRDYLTRPPIQRFAPNGRHIIHNGDMINIEYDAIHFKTDTVDETLSRPVLHYEIAQALRRQRTAEEKIQADGYTVLYAVNDAQLSLLLGHLQDRADGYSSHHDPDETTKVDHEVKDPSTNAVRVEIEHRLAQPHYMREITDERVVMAYKALTAPCIMFCVGKKVRKEIDPPEETVTGMPAPAAEVAEDTIVVKTEPTEAEQATRANVTSTKPPPKARKGRPPKKQQTPVEEVRNVRDPEKRDWKFRPHQACAIFEDKIDRNDELAFDTQVFYYRLPFDELPTQPPSLVRDEAYLEKERSTIG